MPTHFVRPNSLLPNEARNSVGMLPRLLQTAGGHLIVQTRAFNPTAQLSRGESGKLPHHEWQVGAWPTYRRRRRRKA